MSAALCEVVDHARGVRSRPTDPDDAERTGLPSDDEEGPPEQDDDDDARLPNDGLAERCVDGQQEQPEAVGDAMECGSATSPPELPASLQTLRVIDLKIHLWWRNKPTAGNKADLAARLKQAIDDGAALRTTAQAEEAGGCPHVASTGNSVEWEAIDPVKITRPTYQGSKLFVPNPQLGWSPATHPFTYMDGFYPASLREMQVDNSKRYRGWLKAHGKEIYPHHPDISARTNSLAHALLLCQGASPVPDQRRMFTKSFFYKDHRGGDLLTRDEWITWKAFFHITDPMAAPQYGSPQWDELHKVRPMLDEYLRRCIANLSDHGQCFSIDEITIGFQGHHARLKLRWGKFKNAGDGFQVCRKCIFLTRDMNFLIFRITHTCPLT